MSRGTLWRVLAVALPVLGALVAPLPAVDLAYQLRAGSEILDAGAIPTLDTWTFTAAGAPWLDQQWGAQVLLAQVVRLGGWTGLALLRAGLVGLAFGLLLLVIRRRAPGLGLRSAALLVVAAFVASANALALRPQLLAIDLFAATLLVLAVRRDHPRVLWLIPILAVTWANLHGTFPLVVVLSGLAWLGDLAEESDRVAQCPTGLARHRMLIVAFVAAAATIATPFGPAVWGYVANLTSNATIAGRVSEWQPPSPLTVPGAIVWLSLLAVGVAVALRIRRTRRAPWPALLTLLVFGGFAAISGRGTAWWPFVAAFVVAPWLASPSDPARPGMSEAALVAAREPQTPRRLRRLNGGLVALLIVAGVALLPVWRPLGAAGVPVGSVTYAPQAIAARLNGLASALGPTGEVRIWNPQAWGSWLEFAAPGYRYATDSRIELFPATVWATADAIAAGDLEILATYEVDVVITDAQADTRLVAALRDPAQTTWRPLFEGCEGSIWVTASLRDVAPTVERCP